MVSDAIDLDLNCVDETVIYDFCGSYRVGYFLHFGHETEFFHPRQIVHFDTDASVDDALKIHHDFRSIVDILANVLV